MASLALTAGLSLTFTSRSSAQDPAPTTTVLIPSNGATLSGATYLDASASDATSVEFVLMGGIYGSSGHVVCTTTPTLWGWLCAWNTISIPNGSYTLESEAFNASTSAFSSSIAITINNQPATSVLIPSSGATLYGSTYLDASASDATSVEFRLFGGSYGYSGPVVCTTTPTLWGWLCAWNTTTVPNGVYALVSEAFNSSASAFSSVGAVITVSNYTVTNYTNATDIEEPFDITAGPDGALWFTNGYNNSIGRITTAGVVTDYKDPGIVNPFAITAGPDGALWFTESGIGRITTSGTVTNYPGLGGNAITTGSDGALWFTNGVNSIGRITTAGVMTHYTDPSIDAPGAIAAGPDGALWFANFQNNSIGRITTAGVVTNYTDPSIVAPCGITAGPDGALWFTNGVNSIGRITTAGVLTTYSEPTIFYPFAITVGSDGALWFVNGNNSLGRITP